MWLYTYMYVFKVDKYMYWSNDMCLYGISDRQLKTAVIIQYLPYYYVYGVVQNDEQDLLISKSYRWGFKILVFVKIMS